MIIGLFVYIGSVIVKDKKRDQKIKEKFEKDAIGRGKNKKAAKKEAETRFADIKKTRTENGWLTFAEIAIAVPIIVFLIYIGLPTVLCYGIGILVSAIAIQSYKSNNKK